MRHCQISLRSIMSLLR